MCWMTGRRIAPPERWTREGERRCSRGSRSERRASTWQPVSDRRARRLGGSVVAYYASCFAIRNSLPAGRPLSRGWNGRTCRAVGSTCGRPATTAGNDGAPRPFNGPRGRVGLRGDQAVRADGEAAKGQRRAVHGGRPLPRRTQLSGPRRSRTAVLRRVRPRGRTAGAASPSALRPDSAGRRIRQ